jgi:hypothetical protein
LEHDGIGVARGVGDAEVEIQGEPSLIACVQLAQRRAAFEDQRVKASVLMRVRIRANRVPNGAMRANSGFPLAMLTKKTAAPATMIRTASGVSRH